MDSGASGRLPDQGDIHQIAAAIAGLTAADKVYYLGSSKGRYDFLALLPGRAQASFRQYQQRVAEQCRAYGCVMLWCCHTAAACKYLTTGHIFYSLACTADRLVYDNGRPLPEPGAIDVSDVGRHAEAAFHALFAMAASFLAGARYHAARDHINIAAFSLHQATEHALRALLLALTGYNGRGHDLRILFRHCQYCAPSLCSLFPQDAPDEKAIFQLLNRAYLHTRYSSGYHITPAELALLLSRVGRLQVLVRCLFEERLLTFKNHIKCQTN